MRSRPIQLSILISAAILVLSVFSTNQGKYHLPYDIKYHTLSKSTQKQVDCLAENILFEAGKESKEGKVAVALVTLNRVASGNYASDVCGVVKQKTNGICQFSWVCESTHMVKPVYAPLYKESQEVAKKVLLENFRLPSLVDALYYHATYVSPNWRKQKIAQIGQHIFYKE